MMDFLLSEAALYYYGLSVTSFELSRWDKRFTGGSTELRSVIGILGGLGSISSFVFLIFVAFQVKWWIPFPMLIISVVLSTIMGFIAMITGEYLLRYISLATVVIWGIMVFSTLPLN